MPGFAADCVETLEEVAIGLSETFREKGGEKFSAVPCLNDSPVSIEMLETILRGELAGWIGPRKSSPSKSRPTAADRGRG